MGVIAKITIMSEGHSEKESLLRTKEFRAARDLLLLGCPIANSS